MLITKTKLGDLLVRENLITKEDLQKVLMIQKSSSNNKKLGEICIEEGLIDEETIMQVLSKQLNITLYEKATAETQEI